MLYLNLMVIFIFDMVNAYHKLNIVIYKDVSFRNKFKKGELYLDKIITLDDINIFIKEGKFGKFKIKLNDEEKDLVSKRFSEGIFKDREVLLKSPSTFRKLELKDSVLNVELINIDNFVTDFFDVFEEVMLDDSWSGELVYPRDFLNLLERYSEIEDLIYDIVEKSRTRFHNIKYRGNVSSTEDTSDGFIFKKIFRAKYEVLIFGKNNKPYVKLTSLEENKRFRLPNKHYILCEGESNSVIFSFNGLDRFQDINGIKDEEIVLNKDSIKRFYRFNNICFIRPTKHWVEKWWDTGCQNLYRFEPNIRGTTNMWGLGLVCWRNLLVEYDWNGVFIDEDILDEEIEKFSKDYPNTAIRNKMMVILKARNTSEKDKEDKISRAIKIESDIQELINKNEEKIIKDALINFKNSYSLSIEDINRLNLENAKSLLAKLDGQMGLDCGFLYFKILGEASDLFEEIAEYDSSRYKSGALKVDMPIFIQSTTIKSRIAQSIKELVNKDYKYKIGYWTVLD